MTGSVFMRRFRLFLGQCVFFYEMELFFSSDPGVLEQWEWEPADLDQLRVSLLASPEAGQPGLFKCWRIFFGTKNADLFFWSIRASLKYSPCCGMILTKAGTYVR